MTRFLLIHGAWQGGWAWEKVVSKLRAAGHTVLAPDLPGRGHDKTPHAKISLQIYVDFLKTLMPEKTIVVGHSFGGIIASQLANDIPEMISQIVYVAGFFPVDGESLLDISRAMNHAEQPPVMHVDPTGATISLDVAQLPDFLFNCCSVEDREWAIGKMCPEPLAPMMAKVSVQEDRFGKIPKTYIQCLQDNALIMQAQRQMCARQKCHVITLDTDHSPDLSMPNELCAALLR